MTLKEGFPMTKNVRETSVNRALTADEQVSYSRLDSIFKTNGYDPQSQSKVSVSDALSVANAAFLIPRVMTTIVQEGIEPLLIGSRLLQRIDYVPGMQTIFPAVDILHADEAAPDGGLPLYNINVAGSATYGMSVSRHGLGLKIAKDFVENSTYPWINYWLRLAGNALARHKEQYIFSFITSLGTSVFNNDPASRQTGSATQPIKGMTTGRNIKGVFNGSMTVDDIFDLYASVVLNGFVPDVMLMHPMTWLCFVKDPVMREFAIQAGGGSFFQQWQGNPAVQGNAFYNFNGMGFGTGQTGQYTAGALSGGQTSTPEGLPQKQASAPNLPGYLGLPFRIIVSPFARFDPATRSTDILMFNSQNLGALVVKEDPHVQNWEDARYGIQEMFIEESYGFGIINEGQAIATAKNVIVKPNEFVLPARTVFNLSESGSTFQNIGDGVVQNFGAAPTDPRAV
jgi:hypothetical protein